mmetsp:Transcript_18243/g.31069  ORF Transcript_18243/g.31069 Transcript_18243/m.31069 type:complete len:668 (+) Transcript_18243:31-2034(+)
MGDSQSKSSEAKDASGVTSMLDAITLRSSGSGSDVSPSEIVDLLVSRTLHDPGASKLRKIAMMEKCCHLIANAKDKALKSVCGSKEALQGLLTITEFQDAADKQLQKTASRLVYLLLNAGDDRWNSDKFRPYGMKSNFDGFELYSFKQLDEVLIGRCSYPFTLIPLLVSSDRDVLRYSAASLCSILSRNNAYELFKETRMLGTLIQMLVGNVVSVELDVQLVSISSLISISMEKSTHEEIIARDAIENLVAVICRGESSMSVLSAASLCLRLLVQRSPFAAYKRMGSVSANEQLLIDVLLDRACGYFEEFPAHCNEISASAIVDIIIVVTVCSRSDVLLDILVDPGRKHDLLTLAMSVFQRVEERPNTPMAACFNAVTAQLLLHLAMVKNCLLKILKQHGPVGVKYILVLSCEHSDALGYINLHATTKEVQQRAARHQVYSSMLLTKLCSLIVGLEDSTALELHLDEMVSNTVLPIISKHLSQKLDDRPWLDVPQSNLALIYSKTEAAVNAASSLLLREEWALEIVRFEESKIISLLVSRGVQVLAACQKYSSTPPTNGSDKDDLSHVNHKRHITNMMHLCCRSLSNLTMYPRVIGKIAGYKAFIIRLWNFFSRCNKGNFPVELKSTRPELDDSETKIPDTFSIDAAAIEASLGKATLQVVFLQNYL